MTVVVYHSSVTARRIFSNVLGKMTLSTLRICAEDVELLNAARELEPQLIIAEKVPLQNQEYQLLGQLQNISPSPAPSVMVIGYQFTQEETIEIIRRGADELVLLPFTADEFLAKVDSLLPANVSY